jgi:2-iminobutanoate/2-iminopropanoate deaminase
MAKRTTIPAPRGFFHHPIPLGAKIGNVVCSSDLAGRDPVSGEMPSEPSRQAENLFKNIKTFLEQAGGSPANIIHIALWIKEGKHEECMEAINKEWLKMFPNDNDRPARNAKKWNPFGFVGAAGRGETLFQADIVAVLD